MLILLTVTFNPCVNVLRVFNCVSNDVYLVSNCEAKLIAVVTWLVKFVSSSCNEVLWFSTVS